MKIITNMRAWMRGIQAAGDVKCGKLSGNVNVRSLRCAANVVNDDNRQDGKGFFIHVHYCWKHQVAVAVAVTSEEHERELNTPGYANEWKKKIPKDYARND